MIIEVRGGRGNTTRLIGGIHGLKMESIITINVLNKAERIWLEESIQHFLWENNVKNYNNLCVTLFFAPSSSSVIS